MPAPSHQDHTSWSRQMAHAVSTTSSSHPPAPTATSLRWRGASFGGLHVHEVSAAAQRIHHTPMPEWAGVVSLLLQKEGLGTLHYQAQPLALRAGQGVLLDASEPMSLDLHTPYTQVFVLMPRALLGWLPTGAYGQRLDIHSPMDRPALELVGGLPAYASALTPRSGELVAQALVRLVHALHPVEAARARSSSPHLDGALYYIAAHCHDTRTCLTTVASAVGISRRRLDELFRSRGTTIAAFMTRTRLERAMVHLRASPHRTITEIALSEGFKDPSHFSRLFKRSTGVTPSQWRRQTDGELTRRLLSQDTPPQHARPQASV